MALLFNDQCSPTRTGRSRGNARLGGHAGARPEGESHFIVEIASAQFAGLTRVARQRLVYSVLEDELRTDVHALALKTVTPEEDAAG